jgi:hypothetical protein
LYRYFNYIAAYVAVIYALTELYTLFVVSYYYFFTIKNKTSKMNKDVRREIFQKQIVNFLMLNFMEIPHVAVAFYRVQMMNDPILFRTEVCRNEAYL